MRYLVPCVWTCMFLGLSSSVIAAETQFNGYARAGVGLSATGGGQVCFGLGGADSKYRLGNECDYVVEATWTAHLLKIDDASGLGAGSDWGVVIGRAHV